MTTTSITSGTDFIGKTLIIGSTSLSNNGNYLRILDFNNNSTATYLYSLFKSDSTQRPWVGYKPIGQGAIDIVYNTYAAQINVYYIYVLSFISTTQIKYNIYEYDRASTITSKGTITTLNTPNTLLQGFTQFWLGRSAWANDFFYNGIYDKVALYNGNLFTLNDANILSTLLTLVTSTQTNIINNNTYTFRSVGTNFLGVVVNILNYNTTSGSSVTNSNITLFRTTNISGGYLNIIGSYVETAAPSIIMHNFNSSNKSWKMYAHTLSSISGDNLTIKPSVGKNILLEVSANNAIFIKQGDVSYNLSNLTNSISNITTSVTSGGTITATISPFGQEIFGEETNTYSGYNVSLSEDGTIMGITAPFNNGTGTLQGSARIYKYNDISWVQLGKDIDGEANNDYQATIKLSKDGTIVALGSFFNSGTGSVRVFKYNNIDISWIKQGQDIDGIGAGDEFAHSISLSANGKIIAIGALYNDTSYYNAGQVLVYSYNDVSWNKIGTFNGFYEEAYTGFSVSLSSSGTILAISSLPSETSTFIPRVDIYELTNNVWSPKGPTIYSSYTSGNGGSRYGRIIELSSDGTIVAINDRFLQSTNYGRVLVYKYTNSDNSWNRLGSDISGPVVSLNEDLDPYIALSADGTIMAVGYVSDNTFKGLVRLYKFSNNNWIKIGTDLSGDNAQDRFGFSLALSSNGSILSVGSIFYPPNNIGRVKTYNVTYSVSNSVTTTIYNIKDASFSNIDISGNLNPLIVNGSSIGLATKNWNSAYINNIYGETLNTYRSDKTLAINSNISTISGDLITSGNINPLNNNGSSLGISSKIWGNAYIRDVSVTSIDISGHIICPRDISINIGSSLRRWRNVFSDDLSVNKINGQVYSGSSSIVLTSVSGDIIPSSNNLFKLGDVSRNWSNAYIRDLSISSIDVSQNLNPLTNNGASLGLFNKLWGNAYLRDASVSSIDVSTNLNPLTNNGSSLGLISKTWGNAYIRDVSVGSIDVSQNLNPLTHNGSSLGLPGKYWGNAYLRDISISSIDVSVNSINPFLNNSASLGAPSKTWGNAYIRDLSVSSIDVSGNLNPLTTNTLTLGMPSKVWGNAYIRDISISSIDVSINNINPFLNNGSGLGLVTKTWSNAYLRDASVSSIDISQNLNPLVSGSSTVSIAQGTGGTVTISGGYIIHSFTTVGTSIFRPSSNGSVEVLIVGGGGGGGGRLGGGGGGGGVIWIPSVNVSSDTSYSIVVGDGGTTLNKGQNSSAFGATGAGGGSSGVHDSGDGTAGGSGGGAASNNSRLNIGGGTSGNILGTNNGFIYGCSGGNMTTARTGGPTRAAGGGGAGGPGLNTNPNVTGDTGRTGMGSGGVGIVNAILGPSYYWAGGGGGGGYVDQTGGYGGLGGGGGAGSNGPIGIGGGSSLNSGVDGFGLDGGAGGPNTGGGGGGCGWVSEAGGKGGSGIVVIRYLQGTSGSSGSNLGSSLKRWKNIFVGDLSVNTINGLAYSSGGGGGGAASIVYSAGGSSIVNSAIVSNMMPSLTNTYSLGSTTNYWNNAYIRDLSLSNRAYQEISGDISWNALNGYYGLAKDAYPSLNPLSSGAKAAIGMTVTTRFTWGMSGICWSPQLLIFVGVGWQRSTWSTDGKIWNEVILGNQNTLLNSGWYSVCWSPELLLFVAVADNGRVMRSTDGKNWTFSVEFSIALWIDVCWSPELFLFVAVGFSGTGNRVITSRDGINWTRQTGIPDYSWMAICWSPELRIFAVLSAGGNASMISSNGINWTYNSTPNVQAMRGICWSPELGIFVGVGGNPPGNSMISNNGINWTSYIMPWGSSGSPWKVSWSPQLKLFVVPNNYAGGIFIATSTDGKVWNIITYTGVYKEYPNITWSPELGIFVCLSNSGGDGAIHTALVSSLKGRPPTSYNLFDSCFNRIDENGKWDFSNIAISGTMTAGATNVTSDDRLKHNEVIIANGLAVIDQLRPKFYQKTQNMLDASYNGDLSEHVWTYEAGLIAQEVLQIPDISFVVSDGDYYETVMNYELSYNNLSINDLSVNDLSVNDLSVNDLSVNDLSVNDLSYTIIYYESGKYLISQKYTLNYNSIITYGIAAIKELHAKVKAQDISLLEQHATINSLLTRLQALDPSAN